MLSVVLIPHQGSLRRTGIILGFALSLQTTTKPEMYKCYSTILPEFLNVELNANTQDMTDS